MIPGVMLTVDEEDEECVYDSSDKNRYEEDAAIEEELQTIKDEPQILEEKGDE